MKRYLGIFSIALLSIALNSCMDDEATDNIYLSYRAIDSIQIEQINPARQVTEIKTFFTRKNSCEHIFDYDYRIFRNERTVRLVMSQINDQPCDSLGEAVYHTLKFRPEHHGKYIFHFWNGFDENNNPMYITEEIIIPL